MPNIFLLNHSLTFLNFSLLGVNCKSKTSILVEKFRGKHVNFEVIMNQQNSYSYFWKVNWKWPKTGWQEILALKCSRAGERGWSFTQIRRMAQAEDKPEEEE